MGKPELIDPRALYHGDEFAPRKQKGKEPALQKEMTPTTGLWGGELCWC